MEGEKRSDSYLTRRWMAGRCQSCDSRTLVRSKPRLPGWNHVLVSSLIDPSQSVQSLVFRHGGRHLPRTRRIIFVIFMLGTWTTVLEPPDSYTRRQVVPSRVLACLVRLPEAVRAGGRCNRHHSRTFRAVQNTVPSPSPSASSSSSSSSLRPSGGGSPSGGGGTSSLSSSCSASSATMMACCSGRAMRCCCVKRERKKTSVVLRTIGFTVFFLKAARRRYRAFMLLSRSGSRHVSTDWTAFFTLVLTMY